MKSVDPSTFNLTSHAINTKARNDLRRPGYVSLDVTPPVDPSVNVPIAPTGDAAISLDQQVPDRELAK